MQTLLVTGHTGFVGRAMRGVLQAEPATSGWCFATLPDAFDVRSPALAERIADIRPAGVIHLAAVTSVPESFREPERCFDVNFNGTWNLLRALRATAFAGRLLFVSSGDCYGAVSVDALPVRETQPLRPRSPYAVSKIAAESLCFQWTQTEGMDAIMARSFNHIGPGQDVRFAVPWFAKQIAKIRNHTASPRIVTGDLEITRDLTDVRDVVLAYLALLEKGRTGEIYNVGSGRETRLLDVLNELLALAGVKAELVTDSNRLRGAEQRRAVADVRKIASDTGWSASTPLSKTLADMLDDWMLRIQLE